MTFNTEKRKIFKTWNYSIKNQFQIINIESNDKIILNKINDLNQTDSVYNNIIELSSGWITPEFRANEGEAPFRLFKEYEVVINEINKNLIPYFEGKIVYRLGDNEISLPIPDAPSIPGTPFDEEADIFINSVIEVSQGIRFSDRNIIYRTSIFLEDSNGLPEELQLKFFVNIANPTYYQST